jgi:hypothetical protein
LSTGFQALGQPEALIVLSPYRKPSNSRIVVFANARFQKCLVNLSVLTDINLKAYMKCKASYYLQTYGLVLRDASEEDKESVVAEAAGVVAAAGAAEEAAGRSWVLQQARAQFAKS